MGVLIAILEVLLAAGLLLLFFQLCLHISYACEKRFIFKFSDRIAVAKSKSGSVISFYKNNGLITMSPRKGELYVLAPANKSPDDLIGVSHISYWCDAKVRQTNIDGVIFGYRYVCAFIVGVIVMCVAIGAHIFTPSVYNLIVTAIVVITNDLPLNALISGDEATMLNVLVTEASSQYGLIRSLLTLIEASVLTAFSVWLVNAIWCLLTYALNTKSDSAKTYHVEFTNGVCCPITIYWRHLKELDSIFDNKLLTNADRQSIDRRVENEKRMSQQSRAATQRVAPPTFMCPNCHGYNTGKITAFKRILEHSTFGWASPSSGNTFECYDCGYKW